MNTERKHRLKIVLKLDAIYAFLTFDERVHLIACILGRVWAEYPSRIEKLENWLKEHPAYQPPVVKIDEDKLIYADGTLLQFYVQQTQGFAQKINNLLNI